MNAILYILDANGNPIQEPSVAKWAIWMGGNARIVKQEHIGLTKVSTVFLGIDHNFDADSGPPKLPKLWETMCFGGDFDLEQHRCAGNLKQAQAMHERMVAKVLEKANTQAK